MMTKHQTNDAAPVEVKAAVENLGRAFEDYKSSNDASGLEAKMDTLNGDVDRLQKSIDGLHMAQSRPQASNGTELALSAGANEHKTAFYGQYVRKGVEGNLQTLEEKALNIGTDAEGGYAVPEQLDGTIDKLLRDVSPIRRIANVVQIGSSNYKKLVNTVGAASGWVGEADARAETTAPQFAEVIPSLGELYANPAATQSMLDDGFFNVESWLAEELAEEFGQQEGAAFINGDGVNKPKGFLDYSVATTDDSSRAFGTLQYLATGVDGDFTASDPSDILVDLIYTLRPSYRAGAVFVMNTNMVADIRKFKDADGNYLWRPSLAEGVPATLMGYPVVEAEDMPDMASDSYSIAFGNFEKGYIITDRMGTRVLRDPFSNKPFVHFYTTKRVGGGVVNSEAIKLLKFGLS
jgi:HK97 family phage major capsid protein